MGGSDGRRDVVFLVGGGAVAGRLGIGVGDHVDDDHDHRPAAGLVVQQAADLVADGPAQLAGIRAAGFVADLFDDLFHGLADLRGQGLDLRIEQAALADDLGAVQQVAVLVDGEGDGHGAVLGQGLPLPTRILLGISQGLVDYWWALALGVLVVVLLWQLVARSEAARLVVDRWVLSLVAVGDLARKIEVGRFARTLGTLLRSGVPLLAALGVARDVAGNRVIARALGAVQEGAKKGDGLARPMAETGAFPALAIHMVRVGEETGRIEDMLDRVAGTYETEIRAAVRRFIALLEPVIILGLGLVVLAIVLSILLAILSINELPL